MARRSKGKGFSEHSGKKFYTTDMGFRLAFDIENRIATGEGDVFDEQTRTSQEVVLLLLEMGGDRRGVTPKQLVGESGAIKGYRLTINESMAVFNAAVNQGFLSDNPRDAATPTDVWGGEDESFGPWDI